ncbi:MAG: 4-phosphopantoate--beta-alanine ligase [Thermoplasmatales archaeon]|nr:4-phosphopantoate--beta-alanine ligase [Thermoplasmatales archaeon]
MIPKSHPRYESLMIRKNLVKGFKDGFVAPEGLIAHGRGEAFDYLVGEKTIPMAEKAEKASAAYLLKAKNPVISVNGNTAALVRDEIIKLSRILPAKIEINLFHRTDERINKIVEMFKGVDVLGEKTDAKIAGIEHHRGLCCKEGIFSSDVVLVMLEDGDRAKALVDMKKTVIAVDLNPLSRTSLTANVTVVDNITRALKNITKYCEILRNNKAEIDEAIKNFDNRGNIDEVLKYISKRLEELKW